MTTVIKLEFKRMLKSKTLKIVVLIGIVFSLLISLYIFNGISVSHIDSQGNVGRLHGFAAIEEIKRREEPIQGELTQEKVAMVVESLQSVYSQYDSYDAIPEKLSIENLEPYDNLQGLLLFALPKFDNTKPMSPWSIDQQVAENFPQNYYENMKAMAQDEYKDNPHVISKVIETISATESDGLYYYSATGWNNLSELFMILLLVLAILVSVLFASMYSGSYQSGMSEVFACTRNGKIELAVSKCITTVGISTLFYILCVGVFMCVNVLLYGTQGLQKSMALEYPYLFVTGTMQSFFVSMIVIGFFAIVAQACLTLFFSSVCKSSLSSVVFSIMFAVLPFIVGVMIDKSSRVLYLLTNILPASGVQSYFELSSHRYLQLGSTLAWYPNLMWITGVIYIIVLSGLSILFYKRHQYR